MNDVKTVALIAAVLSISTPLSKENAVKRAIEFLAMAEEGVEKVIHSVSGNYCHKHEVEDHCEPCRYSNYS